MLEKQLEVIVKRYAEAQGWLTRKWVSPAHNFVPDQIFISPYGKVIFVEFKQEGKKPSAGQSREHDKLRGHHCLVYVIDTVEAGKEMVDEHSCGM
jgi:hypothetical protein